MSACLNIEFGVWTPFGGEGDDGIELPDELVDCCGMQRVYDDIDECIAAALQEAGPCVEDIEDAGADAARRAPMRMGAEVTPAYRAAYRLVP